MVESDLDTLHDPEIQMIRDQTQGEEIANAVSHGIGLLLAIAALPLLAHAAVLRGHPAEIAGVSIFASTMILLYFVSTLYHALAQRQPQYAQAALPRAGWARAPQAARRGRWAWYELR